jgi:glutamyl-tRNA synthetase
MAISSLLSKVGTSDPIDVFKDIKQIIKEFDINKFGKSKPKFDKNELSNLNSKFFQLMDYEDIINKLKTMDLNITKEFWYLIRGNIEILDDVKIWMNVCFGNIQTKNIDSDLLSLALKLLPHDQFNENTWSIWTNLLKIESGKKGKDLYKPLRLCLTGQDNGPEMASLISIMGRDKVIERLSFDT